jgi:hypothetical protein
MVGKNGDGALPGSTPPMTCWKAAGARRNHAPSVLFRRRCLGGTRRLRLHRQLEEHFVLPDHPKLRASTLLNGFEALLEVAHVGIERGVACREFGVDPLLRADLSVEFPNAKPTALAQPYRVLQAEYQDREQGS